MRTGDVGENFVLIKDNRVEVRFEIGLPAAGRRVLGKEANRIFSQTLEKIVDAALLYENIDHNELKNQISLMIDQEYIREELKRRNLVAFVADGSVLPRESGVSDKPLRDGIPFQSPKVLKQIWIFQAESIYQGWELKKVLH